MRRAVTFALLLFASASGASAHISPELIRSVLRGAGPAVRQCQTQHTLPDGRYSVVLTLEPGGRVRAADLRDTPAPISRPGASCLRKAFLRLRFPANGRGTVSLTWPFLLAGR